MTSPTTARPTSGETTESREPGAAIGVTWEAINRAADEVVQRVAEYDDRTSPDDFPEALLITPSELHTELVRFAGAISPAPDATVSEKIRSQLEEDAWAQASIVSGYWIRGKPDHEFVNVCNGDLRKLEEATHDIVSSSPQDVGREAPISARDAVIEALEPFAKIADDLDRAHEQRVRHYADEGHKAGPPHKDSEYIFIRIGDCRKARATIRSLAQGAK